MTPRATFRNKVLIAEGMTNHLTPLRGGGPLETCFHADMAADLVRPDEAVNHHRKQVDNCHKIMRPISSIHWHFLCLLCCPESGCYLQFYDSARSELRSADDSDKAHLWDFCGMYRGNRTHGKICASITFQRAQNVSSCRRPPYIKS